MEAGQRNNTMKLTEENSTSPGHPAYGVLWVPDTRSIPEY